MLQKLIYWKSILENLLKAEFSALQKAHQVGL